MTCDEPAPASRLVSSRASTVLPRIATRQPCSTSFRAMARPAPLPPPVTTADFIIQLPPLHCPGSPTARCPPIEEPRRGQPEREHHHRNPAYTAAGFESHPRIPTPDRSGTLSMDPHRLCRAVNPVFSRTRAEPQ